VYKDISKIITLEMNKQILTFWILFTLWKRRMF